MRNIAVVLAGGFGQRLGDATPKQFLKLAGKKVIEHTIDVFQNHPLIDEIVVVSNPNYVQEVENILVKNEYSKMKKILKALLIRLNKKTSSTIPDRFLRPPFLTSDRRNTTSLSL